YEIGGLTRQQIQQPQFAFAGPVCLAIMRREHSQHFARTAHKWRRLHRTRVRREHRIERACAAKNGTFDDILDDNPFPLLKGAGAGSNSVMNLREEFKEGGIKTTLRRDYQLACFVEKLYVAHIRGGDFNSRIENLAQQFWNSARLNKSRTQLLHSRHGRKIIGQSRIESPDSFLGALLLRNVSRDLRGSNDLAPLITDRRDREGHIK